jgi:AcrR family transcriptional regulator
MVQQRLLDIAVEAFGRHGLDGASTREIAKAAGTAMSSITYHYGGKEGLYLAVADHVAEQMDEMLPAGVIEAALGNQDADRAREALRTALRLFVVKLQNPQSDGWTLFIMREQMNPTEAFERLYAKRMGGMLDALVSLICLASGTEDREAAKLTAISLLGQVLVLKAARAMCRKLLDRDTLEPAILESYADRLAANVDATLDRMIAERHLTT